MKTLGLIGYPLSHSFSKGFFNEKFKNEGLKDYQYLNFPIENIEMLPALINDHPDLCGLNVTIPYKKQVMKYMDELDNTAEEIGAVNTIKINRKQDKISLKGYNTDAYGFMSSLKPMVEPHHKGALILGTGGAAQAVEYVLKSLSVDFIYVSRRPRLDIIGYDDLNPEIMKTHTIIINTTPLGMYPDTDQKPEIPYDMIDEKFILYDLVYNPELTSFLASGKERGAKIKNGLEMLHQQAIKAWDIWTSDGRN